MKLFVGSCVIIIECLIHCQCVAFSFALPLCSETTDGEKFDLVLELIAGMGRIIFKLFQHPSLAIVKAAGLIMKSIIEVRKRDKSAFCRCTEECVCRFFYY